MDHLIGGLPLTPMGISEVHAGGRVDIEQGERQSTSDLVALALNASTTLGGRPVRCLGIVTGATLL